MSFFEELKRRNVFRVAIAYLIMSWLILQVLDVVGPILEFPNWIGRAILLFLAVGFVVSVIVSWAYEVTPEGLKREEDVDRSQSITHATGRKLDFVIIGVLTVALGIFALERFVWHDHDTESFATTEPLEKSIAVIPFANRSADESDAYFVDGIHDDILTQLSKLSGIDRVISRTSVERFRDTDLSIPEIAAALDVATILEGSVQRAGDRVRITMQLIDAANDEHIWADNFDRELTANNVFDIQSEISTAIATALQAVLTDDEASDLTKLPTDSLAAWEKYQLGNYEMRDRSLDGLSRARAYFEEAIEIDQDFALAYVRLADAINLGVVWGYEIDAGFSNEEVIEVITEAEVAAKRALDIDPRLGEAYAALGYSQWNLAGPTGSGADGIRQAAAYYRQALELVPNYADVYRWYAQTLRQRPINQPMDALPMAKRAVALDPMLAVNHQVLAGIYEINGRYEEALTSNERAMEIEPTAYMPYAQGAHFMRRHSEYLRVVIAGRQAVSQGRAAPALHMEMALAYRQLNDMDQYHYWSEPAVESDNFLYAPLTAAFLALNEGDTDTAVEQFERTLEAWSDCWDCIHHIAHIYARNEQPEALLLFLNRHAPGMLDRINPEVWPQAAMLAAPAAWAFKETGEPEHSEKIIELGLDVARHGIRQADWGYGMEIADIEMHAVQGNYRFALEALTQAVEGGYRNPEWLDKSPFLDPIREEPEFIAAMDIIRTELAAQRARLEEMEQNGELPSLP